MTEALNKKLEKLRKKLYLKYLKLRIAQQKSIKAMLQLLL